MDTTDTNAAKPTIDEYLDAVLRAFVANKNWRWGQAHYNVLSSLRNDLCAQLDVLRQTDISINPYYVDRNVDKYLTWLGSVW